MIKDIKYSSTVNFIGRNGMFKQTGISIQYIEREFKDHVKSVIELQPFTSRDVIGHAMLEIPLADVPSVIEALQKVVADAGYIISSNGNLVQWSSAAR